MTETRALTGVRVLDFSTLLPGPTASLLLREAGATVLKIERAHGDDMRRSGDQLMTASAKFAVLNGGKRSAIADLKSPTDLAKVFDLAREADIVIEQFRPGVMASLGLGYEDLARINPGVIYCSITGYGQVGPRSQVAGHDLNYMADSGILGQTRGVDGAPVVPPVLTADIGGGAYPALFNILLALQLRQRTGEGRHLDISMFDNLYVFAYSGWAQGLAANRWPQPSGEITTGGSPRYMVYRTRDDAFLAVACVEDRFWEIFVRVIGLQLEPGEDRREPRRIMSEVATILAGRTAGEWAEAFHGLDVCVSRVLSMEEAITARTDLDKRMVFEGDRHFGDLPLPISDSLRISRTARGSPQLGLALPTDWAELERIASGDDAG